jgi:hypothetical protein
MERARERVYARPCCCSYTARAREHQEVRSKRAQATSVRQSCSLEERIAVEWGRKGGRRKIPALRAAADDDVGSAVALRLDVFRVYIYPDVSWYVCACACACVHRESERGDA